ncbi:SH3 domain-containing protein [Novosphingobium sp. SL115]|uniref:SH3 domain-containing protein n=1 Tax=Novosphingobium sp. SL115 TaxID=2995150 RepID=UPI002276C5D9|nr:SH3 domain-containing protein [Novosphingobium sp. SL115]MCY1670138.1 SH3 domain-containing protein [Novosphingobium sp. SL115]
MFRKSTAIIGGLGAIALTAGVSTTAMAAEKEPPVALTKCDKSYGAVALVDGDTQGWTKYGLGSPRELIAALAVESGCFTIHNTASGKPATFLMNVIAGDKEEVDKSIETAKGVAMEGLVRSGAASGMLRGIPGGGSMLGMLGGFGGKKKTIAAGIRLISPANGQTIAQGSGEVKKTSISFGGGGGTIGAVANGATGAAYANSKDGQMLIEAFIKAFNAVSAQGPALASMVPAVAVAAAPVAQSATTAVDTKMFASPNKASAAMRTVRAGTALSPTGQRQGLFIEVQDSFGTKGWVSVEDMR